MRSSLVRLRAPFCYSDSLVGDVIREQPQTSLLVSLEISKATVIENSMGKLLRNNKVFIRNPKAQCSMQFYKEIFSTPTEERAEYHCITVSLNSQEP